MFLRHSTLPLALMATIVSTAPVWAADSLPRLDATPRTVDEVWADYDPRVEALEATIVREWRADGLVMRYVVYTIGTFKGERARMAAYYGFPEGGQNLPALLHMHGGGQRAFRSVVARYAKRGYAVLSVNWGGRPMEDARPGEPNTDWGAVDPTQTNVGGYSSLLPGPGTIDPFPSARNNNWFLLTVGCRRGVTFLQQQPEVDASRIGAFGHSMGGRLTGLVAGSDPRVKAASPSVGGSGFLQHDLWGLPGSARRVSGDVALFGQTIAGQAYLARVRCPILFLSSTNDFNAPMDFVERGMRLVPDDEKRTVHAPHLNHRFTPETEIARPLWFDAHLQRRLAFPATPAAELILGRDTGVPLVRVKPDRSRPIERVDIYYGYERDPRNRFWAAAVARERDGVWEAECPVFDLSEPLFVFANVCYRLGDDERRPGDPSTFALSVYRSAYPGTLKKAGVKATAAKRRSIDEFSRGFHDWYTLNANNRHHWLYATRKLADPRWEAPRGGKLAVEVETTEPGNTMAIQLRTDDWRNYSGRRRDEWTAIIALKNSGRTRVELDLRSFKNASGESLGDWFGITELIVQPAAKTARRADGRDEAWRGEPLKMIDLRWVGGDPVRRPKPYGDRAQRIESSGGLADPEFQKAIDASIRREQIDAATDE